MLSYVFALFIIGLSGTVYLSEALPAGVRPAWCVGTAPASHPVSGPPSRLLQPTSLDWEMP